MIQQLWEQFVSIGAATPNLSPCLGSCLVDLRGAADHGWDAGGVCPYFSNSCRNCSNELTTQGQEEDIKYNQQLS